MKLHASGEDYLKPFLFSKEDRYGAPVDVARHLEVSKPSVCHAVAIFAGRRLSPNG